jgi:hypothetical protein
MGISGIRTSLIAPLVPSPALPVNSMRISAPHAQMGDIKQRKIDASFAKRSGKMT